MTAPIVNTPGTKPKQHTVDLARIAEEYLRRQGFQLTMIYGSTTWDDHNNLKCCDLMTSSARKINGDGSTRGLSVAEQKALGTKLRDWLADNAKPLGITGIIWWHKVSGFPHGQYTHYRGPYGVERDYTGPNPHVDHNHVENDGTGIDQEWSAQFWNPPTVKTYRLKVIRNLPAYWGPSKPGKVRYRSGATGHGKVGNTIVGTVHKLKDGRYIVTKYGSWYALDNGNFDKSHTNLGGK